MADWHHAWRHHYDHHSCSGHTRCRPHERSSRSSFDRRAIKKER